MKRPPKTTTLRLTTDELDAFVSGFWAALLQRLYGRARAHGLRTHKADSYVFGELDCYDLLEGEDDADHPTT